MTCVIFWGPTRSSLDSNSSAVLVEFLLPGGDNGTNWWFESEKLQMWFPSNKSDHNLRVQADD